MSADRRLLASERNRRHRRRLVDEIPDFRGRNFLKYLFPFIFLFVPLSLSLFLGYWWKSSRPGKDSSLCVGLMVGKRRVFRQTGRTFFWSFWFPPSASFGLVVGRRLTRTHQLSPPIRPTHLADIFRRILQERERKREKDARAKSPAVSHRKTMPTSEFSLLIWFIWLWMSWFMLMIFCLLTSRRYGFRTDGLNSGGTKGPFRRHRRRRPSVRPLRRRPLLRSLRLRWPAVNHPIRSWATQLSPHGRPFRLPVVITLHGKSKMRKFYIMLISLVDGLYSSVGSWKTGNGSPPNHHAAALALMQSSKLFLSLSLARYLGMKSAPLFFCVANWWWWARGAASVSSFAFSSPCHVTLFGGFCATSFTPFH